MDYNIIVYIVVIAILFLLVQRNNRRNKDKLYGRKGRNFRQNFRAKKEQRLGKDLRKKEEENENLH